ncbi:MAG TPA: hypothetical protein VH593_20500, partial [Ktedonobacteraceae bacterium]
LPDETINQRIPLPEHRSLLYEQANGLYTLPIEDLQPENTANPAPTPTPPEATKLNTPGYKYNKSVPPLLTPSDQLIYSGIGIWVLDLHHNTVKRIVNWSDDQIITSLAMNQDGSTVAWSTAPLNGYGTINVYVQQAGGRPQLVYQQSSERCPCFRAFSLSNGQQAHPTLLLTNDYGDHDPAQFGLWMLDTSRPGQQPVQLLDTQLQKGPLVSSSQASALLYAGNEMLTPMPNDRSMPLPVGTEYYANSLYLAQINAQQQKLTNTQEILPPQQQQSNVGLYRWVTTPTFSPDGQTLVYVVFSSQNEDPYTRHNSLYTARLQYSNGSVKVNASQLLTPAANAHLLELGTWLDENTLTFFADGDFYALNVQSGFAAFLGKTQAYAHIIGTI